MVLFAQAVIGTAGSGKTTYCRALSRVFPALNRRPVVVNLDAFNSEFLPYVAHASSGDLLTRDPQAAAAVSSLGPNGAMMFAAELLEHNLSWLASVVRKAMRPVKDPETGVLNTLPPYFIFDCPGQFELYTHHGSFTHVFKYLAKTFDMRICVIHLVDCVSCADPATFLSALLVSLQAMVQISLPHISVLSKIDLLPQYAPLPFPADFYTECTDLEYLAEVVESKDNFGKKYKKLTRALCGVVDSFSLVSFVSLCVTNPTSVKNLIVLADRANGYSAFGLDPLEDPLFLVSGEELFTRPFSELGDQGEAILDEIQEKAEQVEDKVLQQELEDTADESSDDGGTESEKESDDEFGEPPPLE